MNLLERDEFRGRSGELVYVPDSFQTPESLFRVIQYAWRTPFVRVSLPRLYQRGLSKINRLMATHVKLWDQREKRQEL